MRVVRLENFFFFVLLRVMNIGLRQMFNKRLTFVVHCFSKFEIRVGGPHESNDVESTLQEPNILLRSG